MSRILRPVVLSLFAVALIAMGTGCGRGIVDPSEPGAPGNPGDPRTPAGRSELVAFTDVGSAQASGEARIEVTTPADLDRYLATTPTRAAASIREQLSKRDRPDGDRLFAFQLTGCAETGAELTIGDTGTGIERLSARLTGDSETRCVAAVEFVAVFSVPGQLLTR